MFLAPCLRVRNPPFKNLTKRSPVFTVPAPRWQPELVDQQLPRASGPGQAPPGGRLSLTRQRVFANHQNIGQIHYDQLLENFLQKQRGKDTVKNRKQK